MNNNTNEKKIFIIAGEASGDLLGSKIMHSLIDNNQNVKIHFAGIGGEKMIKENFSSIFPMSELSLMGFFEILPQIFHLLKRIKQTIKAILDFQPDLILTIDSPGFSFRILEKLRSKNKDFFCKVKKVHLIAPSVWAYKENRAKRIANLYDLLLCILPFEPPYFEKYGLKTEYIGHTIFDDVDKNINKCNKNDLLKIYNISYDTMTIILTPGSREAEVERIYPIMIKSINLLKEKYNIHCNDYMIFTFANANTQNLVEFITHEYDFKTKIIVSDIEKSKIMLCANIALAKSGTNTFEFNIYNIPIVVVYKFNWLTDKIVRKLAKIKYANLVNILANQEIIPEFMLEKADPILIANKLSKMLKDKQLCKKQLEETKEIIKQLGYGSSYKASDRGAEQILNLLLNNY